MNNHFENAKKTWETEREGLESLQTTISPNVYESVLELLVKHEGRIFTAGCGTSAMAAKKIAHTLTCVEKPAMYLNPSDAVHGALGNLQEKDILILISKGGNTKELLPLLETAGKKGVAVIGVTENEKSAIAKNADYVLNVNIPKEPDTFNMLATASTLAVIALFDAISIRLMEVTDFSKEKFQLIHPGGAVGTRLSQDIED